MGFLGIDEYRWRRLHILRGKGPLPCFNTISCISSQNRLTLRHLFLIVRFNLSSWCLVMVERLFFAMPRGCLRFVIFVFPDHTHLQFLMCNATQKCM